MRNKFHVLPYLSIQKIRTAAIKHNLRPVQPIDARWENV